MSGRAGGWGRAALGSAVVVALVAAVGTGPVLRGVRAGLASLDLTVAAAALLLGVPVTVACAWRWCVIGQAHGLPLRLRDATAEYYRSQLLNCLLPLGVLGDADRAVRHGRRAGATGRSVRVAALDRLCGQLVLLTVAGAVLAADPGLVAALARVPEPWPRVLPWAVLLVAAGATALAAPATRRPTVVVASVVALAGHVATFLVAARAAGVTTSAAALLPIALVVLLAMGLPLGLAGWGPREGAAAWAFAAVGAGASAGVATAVVYGVMALVAALPGVLVLLAGRRRASTRAVPAEAVLVDA